MKKFILPFLLFAAIFCIIAFQKKEPITLKLNLKKGAVYSYEVKVNVGQSVRLEGQTQHLNSNNETDMRWKVIDRFGDDSTLIRMNYVKMIINKYKGGRVISINSESSDSIDRVFRELFNAVKDNSLTLKLNSKGELLDVYSYREFYQGIEDSLYGKISFPEKWLKNIFNLNILKLDLVPFCSFPNRPVSLGDNWTTNVSNNFHRALIIHIKYTLKEIYKQKVLLDIFLNVSNTKDSTSFEGVTVPFHFIGTGYGTCSIDRSTGLMSNSYSVSNDTMAMTIYGQPINFTIEDTSIALVKQIQ